jgi:hypothetical protein
MPVKTRFKNPDDPDYDQSEPVSEYKDEQVRWLLPGWIPAAKISVIFGEPGVGKSHVTLDIAARLTTGRAMPSVPNTEYPIPNTDLLPVRHPDVLHQRRLTQELLVVDTL